MPDNFTRKTSRHIGKRAKSSLGGMLFGFILLLGGIVLLWYNEGRAVDQAKGLTEGAEQVLSLSDNNIDSTNEGKLIHTTGEIYANDSLVDTAFGIGVKALALNRKVEMFQWKQSTSTCHSFAR